MFKTPILRLILIKHNYSENVRNDPHGSISNLGVCDAIYIYNRPNDDLITNKEVVTFGWGDTYSQQQRPGHLPKITSCMTNNEGPIEDQFKTCDVKEVRNYYIINYNLPNIIFTSVLRSICYRS